MIRLVSRIEALEKKRGAADGPSKVVSIAGTDTSDEAVAAFLAPYGIDPHDDDTLIIIVRPLVAPEGIETRPVAEIPLSFVGGTPHWVRALPAYKARQA